MHINKILLNWRFLRSEFLKNAFLDSNIPLNKLPILHATDGFICSNLFIESKNINTDLKYDVYVISVNHQKRIDTFSKYYNLSQPYKIFNGINAKSKYFNYKDHKYTFNIEPKKDGIGHAGCTLSHLNLIESLYKSNLDFYVIFEDDSIFFDYSDALLKNVISEINHEIDVIYINTRSSYQVYTSAMYKNDRWENLPAKKIYSKSDAMKIMDKNKHNLRLNKHKNPYLFNGNDGYIITKNGAKKLINFINSNKYNRKPFGKDYNIDTIFLNLSLSNSSNLFDIKSNQIFDKPIINTYISTFPVSDISQPWGIKSNSQT